MESIRMNSKVAFPLPKGNWSVLNQPLEAGVIPAVVDQNTMMLALKMKTGDRIELLDGEVGLSVELVGVVKGSMLQVTACRKKLS